MTYPTEEGFYWVRLYEDWDYDTRVWSNPSSEWTIAKVESDGYSIPVRLEFYLMGDDYTNDDFGMIYEWERIEAHE